MALPSPYFIVGDSAFPHTGPLEGKLVTPLKEREMPTDREQLLQYIALHRAVVSTRQAAEWGMRALQGTFCRLKAGLTVEHAKRAVIIRVCFRLFNLRTRLIGINQITTVYSPHWRESIRLVSYDRVANYYRIPI